MPNDLPLMERIAFLLLYNHYVLRGVELTSQRPEEHFENVTLVTFSPDNDNKTGLVVKVSKGKSIWLSYRTGETASAGDTIYMVGSQFKEDETTLIHPLYMRSSAFILKFFKDKIISRVLLHLYLDFIIKRNDTSGSYYDSI